MTKLSRAAAFGRSVLGRRLLAVAPVLIGVSLCTFFVFSVLPGDAAEQLLGPEAAPEQVAQLRAQMNLAGTPWEAYSRWLGRAVRGDFGRSLASGLPVTTLLADRLPVTLQLLCFALLLAVGVAVPLALVAARRPDGIVDRLTTILCMASLSVPNYVLAVVLVYVFAVRLSLFPTIGFTPLGDDPWRNLVSLTLPALAIAFPLLGFYAQFLRRDLLEQAREETYMVTAAAKGVGAWAVLVKHALRNSLFGLLTVVGLHVGTLIAGTVIIEQVFALPGVGQLLLQAVSTRDVGVVQGIVVLLAFTTVMANLAVDLLYVVLDPRVRYRRP